MFEGPQQIVFYSIAAGSTSRSAVGTTALG
jgi:hypothetical protein